ncbi:MAG: FecR family protein [Pseudobacter sp.]|uniref:FecR family protein n=1 Tax=Pseudobacter sp. TaxID=2045420 RepID=UPI003F7D4EB6
MTKERVQELLRGFADNSISDTERKELYYFLKDAANEPLFVDVLSQIDHSTEEVSFDESYLSILNRVYQLDKPAMQPADRSEHNIELPARRVHFLKTSWFRYAAAVLIIAGLGAVAYLWTNNKKIEQPLVSENKKLQTDLPPGGERAVLTLADGTEIVLDNAANGNIAQQGNSTVIKSDNGQIRYDLKGLSQGQVMLNTMSTPQGGQYQLTLPDGTKVWLNAASSITYPAVFVGKERKVMINGEAYFEVAKNKEMPFMVEVRGMSTVEVLGTSFNINAYSNEETVNTTLVEGSVKINKRVVLKPGQQAVVKDSAAVSVVNNADLEKAIAWKNGLFSFNNADLVSVMRQLERWYGVKVIYQRDVADLTLRGEMYRNVQLSTIMNFLKKMGVNVRLDGKTLIVL